MCTSAVLSGRVQGPVTKTVACRATLRAPRAPLQRQDHRRRRVSACAERPGDVVEAFFKIASSKEDRQPDQLIALLADAVIDAGIEHAKATRVLDEGIDITLEGCLKASHSRAPDATVRQPPFLDTYAHRALCFSGVARAELLSSVSTGATTHVQRHAATLHNGEEVVLTFRLARETTVRAAYKGLASEPQWVLERAWGEYARLQDLPQAGVGPEAALARQLQALQGGDVETAFAFASPANRRQTGPLERFAALLESPIYRPLVRHRDHEVLHCRHPDPDVLAALVKVTPDPLRAPQREPCMYAWTLARQSDAGDEHDGAWMTDSVQVVPVAFLNAWPRARQ